MLYSIKHKQLNRIKVLVNLLQTPDSVEATVKVKRKNAVVPAGCIVEDHAKLILKTFHKHNQWFSNKKRLNLQKDWIAQTVLL